MGQDTRASRKEQLLRNRTVLCIVSLPWDVKLYLTSREAESERNKGTREGINICKNSQFIFLAKSSK